MRRHLAVGADVPLVAVVSTLHMDGERHPISRPSIRLAPMDHPSVVKAHLPRLDQNGGGGNGVPGSANPVFE